MNGLVEHFFRHEYGRLVAVLACRIGIQFMDDIEDAVQATLLAALERWAIDGVPDNPSAWAFRVANNHLAGELRKKNRRLEILKDQFGQLSAKLDNENVPTCEATESQLKMLLVCCDDSIPIESSIVLALKTLCGFGTHEIATRLFTSEANVYKRLSRARSKLRATGASFDNLGAGVFDQREPAVLRVLYLMFTEGHLSSDADVAVRHELCDEALRLALIAAERPGGPSSTHSALIALMHLHRARSASRLDELGGLLLLEEQDRSLWDRDQIEEGLCWLSRSAEGNVFSRYHAEAGVAAEHCLAPSFDEARWERVVECYELLEEATRSPIHRINLAIAVAQWKGPSAGLKILDDFHPPTWLTGSYQWSAVLADLHARLGNLPIARKHMRTACSLAPSDPVRRLLVHRFELTTPSQRGAT